MDDDVAMTSLVDGDWWVWRAAGRGWFCVVDGDWLREVNPITHVLFGRDQIIDLNQIWRQFHAQGVGDGGGGEGRQAHVQHVAAGG